MSDKWKRRSTTAQVYTHVDTDLADFDTAQLLQALIDDKVITEDEAATLLKRSNALENLAVQFALDDNHVDLAWGELIRGRKGEALHHIERALGNQWLGRLS